MKKPLQFDEARPGAPSRREVGGIRQGEQRFGDAKGVVVRHRPEIARAHVGQRDGGVRPLPSPLLLR